MKKSNSSASETSKQPHRKEYSKPTLTRYGRMTELTQAGGGMGPNDGDYQLGSPLVPMS